MSAPREYPVVSEIDLIVARIHYRGRMMDLHKAMYAMGDLARHCAYLFNKLADAITPHTARREGVKVVDR